MKNKKALLLILIVFFIITMLINQVAINYQNKIIYEENIRIIKKAIEINPEMEGELIDAFLSKEKITNDELYLKGIEKIKTYKNMNYILKINFITISTLFVIIYYVFEKDRKNTKLEIIKTNEYIDKIIKNDYSNSFSDYKNEELGKLKNEIGKIVTKILESKEKEEIQKENMREFLSNISHQIKTPLTSLFINNDILKNEIADSNHYNFLIEQEKQLKKIEWLIQNLLKMALLDSNSIEMKREKKDLEKFLNKIICDFKNQLEISNIEVNLIGKKSTAYFDTKWTEEAVSNIFKNAIEHTENIITVEFGEDYFSYFIKIKDNGPGISKENMMKIFTRFYSKSKTGTGIGLSISKDIIEKQGGTIEVKNNNGTEFIIKFYKVT